MSCYVEGCQGRTPDQGSARKLDPAHPAIRSCPAERTDHFAKSPGADHTGFRAGAHGQDGRAPFVTQDGSEFCA